MKSELERPPKKQYDSPKLVTYGDLVEMTQKGSGKSDKGMSGVHLT